MNRPQTLARCAAVAALLAVPAAPVEAQAVSFGGGARLQAYTFAEPTIAGVESVSMLSFPVAATVGIGSRVTFSVSAAWAEAVARGPDGQESTLSGMSDTDLTATFRPGPSWLQISAGATVPTGQSTLSTRESYVASFIAAQLLPFPIATWGTGGSAGGDVAVARQIGAWGVGASIGYRVAQEYEPIPELGFQYKPGDALQARLALDRNVSGSGTLSILLGYQSFAEDEAGGFNLFQSGTRLQGVVSYAFAVGRRNSGLVYGGVNHRTTGIALPVDLPFGGIVDSPSQQLFMGGANFRFAMGRASAILPRAEMLVYRASDGKSQGWVGTLGPEVEWRVAGNSSSTQIVLAPSGYARFGNVIVSEGAESTFFGWEAGLVLRVVPGR